MRTSDEFREEVEAQGKVPPVMGMIPEAELTLDTRLPPAAEPPARSQFELFRRRFLRHRVAVISLLVLIALYVIVIFARQIAPHDPNPKPLPLLQANHPPGLHHLFGTDELGRDQLSRIIFAGRVSLAVGLFVALISTLVLG